MEKYFDNKKTEINGPTNVVRLEGKIDGIKKVIYLFMDWHIEMYNQTRCDNIFAKDIDQYLVDNFSNISKKSSLVYDFFMEIRPTEELVDKLEDKQINKFKGIYLQQVMKLFQKIFKYDKEKTKVSTPEIFKNIRLHYLDIRDYLYNHLIYKLIRVKRTADNFFMSYGFDTNFLKNMAQDYETIAKHFEFIVNILQSPKYNKTTKKPTVIKKKEIEEIDEEMIKSLANKIRKRYRHNNIKKIMNEYVNSVVTDLQKILDQINDGISIFKKYSTIPTNIGEILTRDDKWPVLYNYGLTPYIIKDIIHQISNIADTIYHATVSAFARLTDIYFIRRFLDKSYITNAVVYSGAAHSQFYIKILLNEFNFKITHVAYSAIKNINELTTEIKKTQLYELTRLFSPPILYQCSDISHFPENFL